MIAQTPPMGWNSWDCYGAAVDEPTVRQNAAYMAEHLQVFGWEYVVVDIQWYQPTATSHAYEPFAELTMDEYGRLQPAPGRFPSSAGGKGFKPLADYVHSLGLKFGIHIMRGMPRMAAHRHLPILGCGKGCHEVANPNSICAWNPDMYGLRCDMPEARAYYDSIFRMYAEWGVDFVKCDDIAREYPHCKREIEVISDACRACGRNIVLSLSPGPAPLEQAEHLKKYANMWRITDDFWDEWRLLKGMFERAEKWCVHAALRFLRILQQVLCQALRCPADVVAVHAVHACAQYAAHPRCAEGKLGIEAVFDFRGVIRNCLQIGNRIGIGGKIMQPLFISGLDVHRGTASLFFRARSEKICGTRSVSCLYYTVLRPIFQGGRAKKTTVRREKTKISPQKPSFR